MIGGVEFYYSNLSWQSLRAREFLNQSGVLFTPILCEFGKPLPFSVYGELPVLKHGESVIEDHRLILMYIDEVFAQHKILGETFAERAVTLERIEQVDASFMPPLLAPALLDFDLFIPKYSAELKELRTYLPYRAWKRLRAKELARRNAPLRDRDRLSENFKNALSRLIDLFEESELPVAVQSCIFSALEIYRGENLWWKELSALYDLRGSASNDGSSRNVIAHQ